MRILIIEDEAPAARRLTKLIKEIDPSHEIIDIIESVEDGIAWFETNPLPDLILSDIQLSDNLSFEIFKNRATETPIIFTTAFNQYAIEAFEHLSIDYLLKPVRKEKLEKAIDKLQFITRPVKQFDTQALLNELRIKKYRERILVYCGDSLVAIPVVEIAYLLSEDGSSFLVNHDNKRFILSESLDNVESSLDPDKFFRASRKYIIHIDSIARVAPYFNQKLLVKTEPSAEEDIIVSKLKASDFKKWMNS